jgi:uncharacterized metal-binding protein YceD (DUF177 family)
LCVVGPEKIDVGGVLATGRPLAVDARVVVPAFGSFAFGEPAHVVLDVRRIDRDLAVRGAIDVEAVGACDRCLSDTRRSLRVDVDECLSAKPSSDGGLAENNVLDGVLLDIGDLARQLVDSSLPLLFLCSDDCPGLCPSCGLSRRDGTCSCLGSANEVTHG